MSSIPLVWYRLYDSDSGKPYKGTTASSILRSSLAVPVVDQFRKYVKAENSNKLSSYDAADLVVYKNKPAFDKRNAHEGKEEPLKSSLPLHGLGETKEGALVVVVPEGKI